MVETWPGCDHEPRLSNHYELAHHLCRNVPGSRADRDAAAARPGSAARPGDPMLTGGQDGAGRPRRRRPRPHRSRRWHGTAEDAQFSAAEPGDGLHDGVRDSPGRMNGKTLVASAAPPALPEAATAAPWRSVASTAASTCPPTGSTAPAHLSRCSGLPAVSSTSRATTSAAPRPRSRSAAPGLPVTAVTSCPRRPARPPRRSRHRRRRRSPAPGRHPGPGRAAPGRGR